MNLSYFAENRDLGYVGRWGGNGKTDVQYECVSIKRHFTEEKMTRFGVLYLGISIDFLLSMQM